LNIDFFKTPVAASFLVLLMACSSPPTHFYTLVSPEEALANHDPSTDPFAFELEPASVPPQVDQAQLMVRLNGSEMTPLEFDRWAAPLGDEIRDALSHDLTADLGVSDVYKVPHPDHLAVYRIQTTVSRFDSFPGQYALIEATWSVHPPGPNAVPVACHASISEPVGTAYSSLVEGHQRALKELSSRVAQTVRALQERRGGTVCPG